MQFTTRKRRQPPAVIIVPLIDILMVLLVFMMATSTFKKQPAIHLTLPESRAGKEGASVDQALIVTIAKTPPWFYLNEQEVSLEELRTRLTQKARENPDLTVSLGADTDAPWGHVVQAMDAAKAAGFRKPVAVFVRRPAP